MVGNRKLRQGVGSLLLAVPIVATAAVAGAATLTTIYSFAGSPDGSYADSDLENDGYGGFFGVTPFGGTASAGTAFHLSPPGGGQANWVEAILHDFSAVTDGSVPNGHLIAVNAGGATTALYGTTSQGGTANDGIIFSLSPPASGPGPWSAAVLHVFGGVPDGAQPFDGLVNDPVGNLYGTTNGGGVSGCSFHFSCGVVFRLTPSGSAQAGWTETVLYRFRGLDDGGNPVSSVIYVHGKLYGTTEYGGRYGQGVAFELSPPVSGHGDWTEKVLHVFGNGFDGALPTARLRYHNGSLFGTTTEGGTPACGSFASEGCGTVFRLVPPANGASRWREYVVHRFINSDGADPVGQITFDDSGTGYGTTEVGGNFGAGTAFKLTPPVAHGAPWLFSNLYIFNSFGFGASINPESRLNVGTDGTLYGTSYGGGVNGYGSVFEISQ